ncbi:flagellar hook-basal body protein [Paenibacillus guangzhouensis]|uniref:flagellar hook-basal body protein n=1 Tax=Paenibacillus guangzhouensis TaxID=1473112 RepID=UPI0012671D25|nr:flagellar hook-basal body protein [Paenibacillus guangzhouensis]
MNNSMISAMVSMSGIQQKLDIISDNMANSNTTGYKAKQASFEDVLTNLATHDAKMKQPGRATPLGFTQSWGTRMSSLSEDTTQGSLKVTDVPTDLAVEGNAMFEIALDDQGTVGWTRDGSFNLVLDKQDTDNVYLTTSQGYKVLDINGEPIKIPNGYAMQVDAKGHITAQKPGSPEILDIGYVKVAEPMQPGLLQKTDENFYILPYGAPQNVMQGVDLANMDPADPFSRKDIAIRQGALEQSNVNLANEMVDLMQVQRAYQLTARALTSSDTMMGLANNLRA